MDIPVSAPLIHYTLESPWMVGIGLLVLSFVVTPLLRNTMRITGLRRLCLHLAIFLAGPLLIFIGYMVETSAEQINRLTLEFVDAAIAGDQSTVNDLFAPDLQILVGSKVSTLKREDVITSVPALPAMIPSNTIIKCNAGISDHDTGVSQFSQLSQIAFGGPVPNTWRCIWQRNVDNNWVIVELTWVKWGIDDQIPTLNMLRVP